MNVKFLPFLFLLITGTLFGQTTVYVNSLATGNNDGTTWSNAYVELKDAMASVPIGNSSLVYIKVAEGLYKTSDEIDRVAHFKMQSNVHVLGGYPNTGSPTDNDRDPASHPTIMSGDAWENDPPIEFNSSNFNDNAYTVVYGYSIVNTLIDGFTISGGNSNSSSGNSNRYGGGLAYEGNSFGNTISNCIFTGNQGAFGGVIYSNCNHSLTNNTHSMAFKNCIFFSNKARGAGVAFITNSANLDNSFLFENCLMHNNLVTDSPTNRSAICDMTGNSGGVTRAHFHSCTISDNTGGSCNFRGTSFDPANPVQLEILNCNIYQNNPVLALEADALFYENSNTYDNESNVQVRFSNLQYPDAPYAVFEGNMSVEPRYVSLTDFSLSDCSPLINRGNNAYSSTSDDLFGNSRISRGVVDIGAYEYDYNAGTPICPHAFVDATAAGANSGTNWFNAYTDLQSALTSGAKFIFVAKGTYYPTTGTSRGATFDLESGQHLVGGYDSGGGDHQAPSANPTILSGNIDGVSSYDGNSYHVVRVTNVVDAVVDGVVIRDGNADDASSFGRSRGGGVYINNSTVKFYHTELKWNKAVYGGGVFATLSPNVTFEDCILKKNTATNGSALYHSNDTDMFVYRTKVIDNTSLGRCAIEINNSNFTRIENSLVANNASTNANAIAFIATNRDQTCYIISSTILGESLNKNLITVQVGFGDTFTGHFRNSVIAHQDTNFTRCIKEYNNGVLNLEMDHCYLQGDATTSPGTQTDCMYSTTQGSLHLNTDYSPKSCSPTINAGVTGGVSPVPFPGSRDVDGQWRFFFDWLDIGAFEYQGFPSGCARQSSPLKEKELIEDVKMYPNPTSGLLMLETELENYTVKVYSMLGQQMLSSNESRIDLSDFPSGIYIINILVDDEIVQKEKIIKR